MRVVRGACGGAWEVMARGVVKAERDVLTGPNLGRRGEGKFTGRVLGAVTVWAYKLVQTNAVVKAPHTPRP